MSESTNGKRGAYGYTVPRSRGVREHEPRPEALEDGAAAKKIAALLGEMEGHVKRSLKLVADAERDVRQMRRSSAG